MPGNDGKSFRERTRQKTREVGEKLTRTFGLKSKHSSGGGKANITNLSMNQDNSHDHEGSIENPVDHTTKLACMGEHDRPNKGTGKQVGLPDHNSEGEITTCSNLNYVESNKREHLKRYQSTSPTMHNWQSEMINPSNIPPDPDSAEHQVNEATKSTSINEGINPWQSNSTNVGDTLKNIETIDIDKEDERHNSNNRNTIDSIFNVYKPQEREANQHLNPFLKRANNDEKNPKKKTRAIKEKKRKMTRKRRLKTHRGKINLVLYSTLTPQPSLRSSRNQKTKQVKNTPRKYLGKKRISLTQPQNTQLAALSTPKPRKLETTHQPQKHKN